MKSGLLTLTIAASLFAVSDMAISGASHHDMHGDTHTDVHGSPIGKPGNAAGATRTIQVDMKDNMRFQPETITVKNGETVRFLVKNSGKLKHEMVLGSPAALREHAEMMRKMPEMEHADDNMVAVEPGQTGELIWQFTQAGTYDFACLQPGHFEAGMKGKIKVNHQ